MGADSPFGPTHSASLRPTAVSLWSVFTDRKPRRFLNQPPDGCVWLLCLHSRSLFGRNLAIFRFWGLSKTENRQLPRRLSLNGDRKLVYTQGGVGARLFRGDKPVREAFSTKSWPEQDGAENIISLEARDFDSESGTVTTSRRGLVLGARKTENAVSGGHRPGGCPWWTGALPINQLHTMIWLLSPDAAGVADEIVYKTTRRLGF